MPLISICSPLPSLPPSSPPPYAHPPLCIFVYFDRTKILDDLRLGSRRPAIPASPATRFLHRLLCSTSSHSAASLFVQPAWALALAAVGHLVAARAVRLALWVYAAFLRPGKPLRRCYGPWAIVTGATDGIGRAMAFRLAAAGRPVGPLLPRRGRGSRRPCSQAWWRGRATPSSLGLAAEGGRGGRLLVRTRAAHLGIDVEYRC